MNYGHYGRDLLLELKRSSADRVSGDGSGGGLAPLLPSYNDVLVSNALQDLRLHVQALQDQVSATNRSSSQGSSQDSAAKPSLHVRPSILLQNAAIERNKRCLLAYHVERLNRIKHGMYWQQNVPSSRENKANKQLCPAEDEFLTAYQDLVQGYTSSLGGAMQSDDLRAHGMVPPLAADERVQVRVVKPIGVSEEDGDQGEGSGEIVLESGATAVLTTVGSTHYLLWNDVEEYVRIGSLKVIEGEEQ